MRNRNQPAPIEAAPAVPPPGRRTVRLPNAPVLVAGIGQAAWISPSGEIARVSHAEAAAWVRSRPPMLCHGPTTARRLEVERFPAFDLLELYAFARPARFCLPTPRGLARALELPEPTGLEDEAAALHGAGDRHRVGDNPTVGLIGQLDPVVLAGR